MFRPLSGVVLATALLLPALVGCSRPPELVGIDNPEIPAASVAEASRHHHRRVRHVRRYLGTQTKRSLRRHVDVPQNAARLATGT